MPHTAKTARDPVVELPWLPASITKAPMTMAAVMPMTDRRVWSFM
jgi:hypothetical protein